MSATDLSPAEASLIEPPDEDALWRSYRRALSWAGVARDDLRGQLRLGLDPAPAIADAESLAALNIEAAYHLHAAMRLIDAHCEAQRALYDAAHTICDALDLPDGGRAEGVKWALNLTSRRKS